MAQCNAWAAQRFQFNLQMQEIRLWQKQQQQKAKRHFFLPGRRQIDFCEKKYAQRERQWDTEWETEREKSGKTTAPRGGSVKNYALEIDFPATLQNRKKWMVKKADLSCMEFPLESVQSQFVRAVASAVNKFFCHVLCWRHKCGQIHKRCH